MDRRTLLAIGLMLIVALVPAILMPNRRTAPEVPEALDSLTTAAVETVVVERPVPGVEAAPAVLPLPADLRTAHGHPSGTGP